MVERESYLLELSRYVVLNPVRAGVGLPSVWEGLRGQVFLGSDEFVQRMTEARRREACRGCRRHRAKVMGSVTGVLRGVRRETVPWPRSMPPATTPCAPLPMHLACMRPR
jgi:hypothetical protein